MISAPFLLAGSCRGEGETQGMPPSLGQEGDAQGSAPGFFAPPSLLLLVAGKTKAAAKPKPSAISERADAEEEEQMGSPKSGLSRE